MCESAVFLRREGDEELVAEDVARVVPEGEQVRVVTLLGEVLLVRARIAEIDLMGHKITLVPL
jgi:predicted RNA-binding protein